MTGRVYNIQRCSLDDGPGVRTVVFLKGCPLRCLWCHNPEGLETELNIYSYPSKCTRCGACAAACAQGAVEFGVIRRDACVRCGACALVCPSGALQSAGRDMSVEDVMRVVKKDIGHYRATGGGLTISGGEPLLQPEFCRALLEAAREAGISTCVETGGVPSVALDALIPLVDEWLLDIKADEERHERLTGAPLSWVLESLEKLLSAGARVTLRCPMIPGVNDTEAHFAQLRALSARDGVTGVKIMPYHETGTHKYAALGRAYALDGVRPPPEDTVARWEQSVIAKDAAREG